MKDARLRVPVDPAYIAALGLAAYCFARLEWNAVYCGEKLRPGYLGKVARKTAGQIASDIRALANVISEPGKRSRYSAAASEFARLVDRRNDLLHANPGTVRGKQRLVRHGSAWERAEIEELADEFTACSMELNELYHQVL